MNFSTDLVTLETNEGGLLSFELTGATKYIIRKTSERGGRIILKWIKSIHVLSGSE